jgi:BirA family biotin operon repressor/biotin-[acetyl-CoA-carboxylase] ligase
MDKTSDDLSPDAISAALRTRIVGRHLDVHAVVDSTNDLVWEGARRGEAEGFCVIADRQAAGRGRRGRPWVSLPGLGLYTSILLRPSLPAPRVTLLTFGAGLAALEAIRETCGLDAGLKWPNDVLVRGRKVVGILTEAQTMGGRVSEVVVGIGINANHRTEDFPEELRQQATSLHLETGSRVDRGVVAAALYRAMDDWYRVLCEGGGDRIVAAARSRSAVLGRSISVINGTGSWSGLALDLDNEGALLVRDERGTVHRLISEEVSIRVPSA